MRHHHFFFLKETRSHFFPGGVVAVVVVVIGNQLRELIKRGFGFCLSRACSSPQPMMMQLAQRGNLVAGGRPAMR